MWAVSWTEPVDPDGSPLHSFFPESEGEPVQVCGRNPETVVFSFNEEGDALRRKWFCTGWGEDYLIAGVIADWLQDHRDLLLSGAVGPNPAERLEQVIEWFRQHFERGSYATQ